MEKERKRLSKAEYLEIIKELTEQLEKQKMTEEVNNKHDKTFKIILENKEILLEIVNYTLNNYIDKETIKKITNKIKEGSGNMLAVVEMLEKERQRDIKKGIKIGEARGEARGAAKNTLKLAKRMLKENFTIEIIEKITGLKREKFM